MIPGRGKIRSSRWRPRAALCSLMTAKKKRRVNLNRAALWAEPDRCAVIWTRMSPWGRSGRRRTGSSADSLSRAAAGDGAVMLAVLSFVSYPLLAVLSLIRSLLRWLWRRTAAAVRSGPRATAAPPLPLHAARLDSGPGLGSGSPERGERVRRHHGRAFEFISAALRIDEDERGTRRSWQLPN